MSSPQSPPALPPPTSILILGAGVFGLSTALGLSSHPSFAHTRILLLDRHPPPLQQADPHPAIASVDSSRLVRADYADPAYAALAAAANAYWRDSEWGADGRYTQSGLMLLADKGRDGYVRRSLENVRRGGESVRVLEGREEVRRACKVLGGGMGEFGYVNEGSGWADAGEVVRWVRGRVWETKRVEWATGEVVELVYAEEEGQREGEGGKVVGARLATGEELRAELTVVAMGAWSGRVVDLRGRASATGQVLAYVDLDKEEQQRFANAPVPLNLSRGVFVVPPSQGQLKVARHGYGYANPVRIPHPDPRKKKRGEEIVVSLPRTTIEDSNLWAPKEGEEACRQALREFVPDLGERPFSNTRLCWYSDTPKGDYLITYHPDFRGLFLATGGSGHGFKMFPVLGDKIVDCILGQPPEEFKNKWCWSERQPEDLIWTEDGSRSGRKGMNLDAELRKGSRL
ncbi:MAG: hypothetical protein M1821_009312 [Bathelium mastoideum]|nr:MAG: hypothetical protein M1821_009312 [Bathelium mastoideum]